MTEATIAGNPATKSAPESLECMLGRVREMVSACMQCGSCTGSCPNEFAMDYTPRRIWRMVLMGEVDDIFKSKTFTLCSNCYMCTLRCPRGLPLTDAMSALKQIAFQKDMQLHAQEHAVLPGLPGKRQKTRAREGNGVHDHVFRALEKPAGPADFHPPGTQAAWQRQDLPRIAVQGQRALKPAV